MYPFIGNMYSNENRNKQHTNTKILRIFMIGTILTLIATAATSTSNLYSLTPSNGGSYAYAKSYEKNQAMSQADACGNGKLPLNILCQNIGSEIQGDENAVNMIGLQTGGDVRPPPVVEKATLNVIKQVICPEGFVCPAPGEFTISVTGTNPDPNSFPGSATGTAVSLEPGAFQVTELAPAPPTGLVAQPPVFSAGCTGNIQAGQELSCTITNEFVAAPCEAPIDLVFVLDDTGSMGGAIDNMKSELDNLITQAETASGGDLKMGFVTFKDQVDVKNELTTDIDAVRTSIMNAVASGGAGLPEAADQAKNTTVNNLGVRAGQPLPFTEPYRAAALKINIVITDAPPGGFNENVAEGAARMHNVALESVPKGILVSDVYVPTGGVDPVTQATLQDDADTSGGQFATVNADGTGTADAISDVIQGCGTG
jgi:uncharacterized protein YegL